MLTVVVPIVAALLVASPADAATSAPKLAGVSPTSGTTTGATAVTVTGSGFTGKPSVRFGSIAGTAVHVLSSTKLQVTAPAHGAGLINIRVTTSSGTTAVSAASQYTYVSPPAISSVTPATSVSDGGGQVTVTGYHFRGAVRVRFGAVYATGVQVVSPSELRATVPAHSVDDVGVRVYTPYGVSSPEPFTYLGAPAPVTGLAVIDSGRTTASLQWQPSPTSGVTHVVVVRVPGNTPPASPAAGTQVASLPATSTRFVDTGLSATTAYSYSVFAASARPVYSTPASVSVVTPDNSRPDTPTGLTLGFPPRGATSDPCDGTGYVASEGVLTFVAHVSDPDHDTVLARFGLVDLGVDGTSHTVLLDPDTRPAQSAPVSGSGFATDQFNPDGMVDGNLYALSATADDGRARSAAGPECRFRYDDTPSNGPSITSTTFPASGPAAHVGAAGTFAISADDTVQSSGNHIGVDYFVYSFSSPSAMDKLTGTYTSSGGVTRASIPYTATEWGTTYLYVATVDRAGWESQPTRYTFYVSG